MTNPPHHGMALLEAWIATTLYDYVLECAREDHVPVDRWVEQELVRAVARAARPCCLAWSFTTAKEPPP